MNTANGGECAMASVVAGLGSWLPSQVVTNEDLARRLDTSHDWIVRRTGITQRRVLAAGLSTLDMATAAASNALKSAGCADVDAVLLATSTPDRPSPAVAPELAARLGLTGVAACDISAACSGFLYLLALADGLIANGLAERVLLVAAETYSRIVDHADRATAIIFGDGAGAMVLRRGDSNEAGAIRHILLGSDGDGAHLIHRQQGAHLVMQGAETYRRAIETMAGTCRQVLAQTGWEPADVDAFVPHQANRRIMDAVADRLGIAAEHRVSNIEITGNTAAASIPLALADAADTLRQGARVLLTAFGGGLTWGSATLSWPALTSVKDDDARLV